MTIRRLLAASVVALTCLQPTLAADLLQPMPVEAAPVPIENAASSSEQRGIWGAIAFSETDGKHGFFWGADKRNEAENNAFRHCERAGGNSCVVVTTFRNHRHWDDDDGSGFPYHACAALAVGETKPGGMSVWGATSAPTRKEAEQVSLQACQASDTQCQIREWVCT